MLGTEMKEYQDPRKKGNYERILIRKKKKRKNMITQCKVFSEIQDREDQPCAGR
jgi:hypothetical protein